jgi:hypothetical protein
LHVIDLSAVYADGDRYRTATNFAVDDKLRIAFARIESGFKVFATMRTGDGEEPVHGVLLRLSDSRTRHNIRFDQVYHVETGRQREWRAARCGGIPFGDEKPGRMWQTAFSHPGKRFHPPGHPN